MALEVVGGAFLSALFQKMASGEILDFLRGKKRTQGLLDKLKMTLLSADAVLQDAEEKQLTDSRVKQWLEGLTDAVYHAEDLVDKIKTIALKRKLKAESGSIKYKVVIKPISSAFHAFDTKVNSRIEEILDMLDFIVKQKDTLNLKSDDGHTTSETILPPFLVGMLPPATTSNLVDSDFYGREKEKESFLQLLLSADATGNKISVLPIVGMGGIGKTTFAQLIYNHVKETKHFDLYAWVCVSQKFDVDRITQTIYESITGGKASDITNLDMLQCKLKEALTGKKFLFVHDDVWNENYDHWNPLWRLFQSGAHGSKIIVTTRIEGVAAMMGRTPQTCHLTEISEEDCWLLFAKHAFENATDQERSNLEVIGRQIARKCKGLPLAAKSLGGLLRSKLNIVEEWKKILNSNIWELSLEKSHILPALWLSYHYLPPYLKRCFVYCSIFPKNYEFGKSELMLLWKATDLLQPKHNEMMEEVGEDYFNDLISRSFFQRANHSKSKFIMHDLINDLANFVSGEFCVRWDDNESPNIVRKTRHFSYMEKYGSHGFDKFEALYEAKYLRTFLPSLEYWFDVKLRMPDAKVLHDFFSKLQYLRVLNFARYDLKELPDSIDKLKHLRHLDLSYTSIQKLPDRVCNLYNLQTLLLSYCEALTQLPTDLGRLINLRHLDIEDTKLQKMPPRMGNLKGLRILSYFVVDKHTAGHDILELKELQFLRGRLCISGLGNLVHVKDALEVNIMRDKKYLNELVLRWKPSVTDDSHQERETKVLEKLQPHTNLKKLFIYSYGGTTFPSWSYGPETPNLTEIKIRGCKELRSLPEDMHSLLPSLESLWIQDCPKLESFSEGGLPSKLKSLRIFACKKLMAKRMQWGLPRLTSLTQLRLGFKDCEDDSFPEEGLLPTTLTSLWISDLLNVKKMDGKGFRHLNSLKELGILRCPELQCLPDEGLPNSLSSLHIWGCPLLSQRCEREKGEEWPKIAHIPTIWIDGKLI